MFGLKPVKNEFFDLFEQLADRIVEASMGLRDMLVEGEGLADRAEAIKVLESQGDETVHEVMRLLHESFITPLERGDIRRLVQSLDGILDGVNAAAGRMVLYRVGAVPPQAAPLAQSLAEAAGSVGRVVRMLRHLDQREEFLKGCVEIHTLENEGDQRYLTALAALFEGGADPLEVIKWKEIYDFIEAGLDRCEEVADIAEGIALENG